MVVGPAAFHLIQNFNQPEQGNVIPPEQPIAGEPEDGEWGH